jgi:hypothetical protein
VATTRRTTAPVQLGPVAGAGATALDLADVRRVVGHALGQPLAGEAGDVAPVLQLGEERVRGLADLLLRHGCGGACGRKRGADCPVRHGGGLVVVEVKSLAPAAAASASPFRSSSCCMPTAKRRTWSAGEPVTPG